MNTIELQDSEFIKIQKLMYDIAGISLSPAKKHLVISRLMKRVREYQFTNFSSYINLISKQNEKEELQMAIDLLTTNETYFFREPKHFDFLETAIKNRGHASGAYRVWSAACSSGQEPYSIAMVLSETISNGNWEIYASDISTKILNAAKSGLYPMDQSSKITGKYLSKYCLKGVGSQEGKFIIDRVIRDKIHFFQANLNAALPRIGEFDVIFLRNVMIYFDNDTKRQVVSKLLQHLKLGGYFLIGHSESLNGISDQVKPIAPSIFRKL